ncbi:MAG: hypothetical protein DI529_17185 [Chryseobacterium sp.]|nr:MAG: hypothetical protein DI529_17185 [Chryseobacterium sp.]
MNEFKSFIKSRKIELFISAIYVGIGTLAVCNVAGSDLLYGDWTIYTLLITFPVTIISFGYRYGETDYLTPVLIIQFVMFVLTFLFLCFVFTLLKSIFRAKK